MPCPYGASIVHSRRKRRGEGGGAWCGHAVVHTGKGAGARRSRGAMLPKGHMCVWGGEAQLLLMGGVCQEGLEHAGRG